MMKYEAFRSRFGLSLDGQQEAAVRQTEGPVLLLAVPGSGKTTVLLARIGCLIFCQDADPRSILTMTYTVAATEEMRRRFAGIFGGEIAAALDFRTINGVCARIIRQYEAQTGRSAFRLITEEGTSARLLREAYRRCMLPYPAESELEEIKTRIAFCKNGMLTDEEIRELDRENGNLFPIYDAYRAILRENRLMDYDDQMVYGLAILRRAPEILSAWRRHYRYFCVDEAQDTSKIQHEIIRLLAGESRNLFMVGDEDQTIYGFRAAYPRALTEFRVSWPEGRILLLETNYRSDAQIVDHADRFIQKNTERHEKHMHTPNPAGAPVRVTELRRRADQYPYLEKRCADRKGQLAILYRNNESVLPLLDLLEKNGTDYTMREQKSVFFSHPVLRDVKDYLRFAADPTDGECFLRIYFKLRCAIKKEAAHRALRENLLPPKKPILVRLAASAEPWQKDLIYETIEQFSLLKAENSLAAIHRIERELRYGEYLSAQRGDAGKLGIIEALARQNPVQEGLIFRLQQLERMTAEGRRGGENSVILSTIHGSKGLEYDSVILMDAFDGNFPQIADPSCREEELALAEERRLFYVAATRAKRELELLRITTEDTCFIDDFMGIRPQRGTRAVPKPSKR